jgi:hypothetical protein
VALTTTRATRPGGLPAGTAEGPGHGDAEVGRRITLWALAVYVATRCVVIAVARLPEITPDEPGSWAVGRWLSGAAGVISMGDMPRYPLVPGAALAPLWWLPVGPELRYQLGLALLTAATVLAAFTVRSAIRMLGADEVLAAVAFALVLLLPASTFSGAFTWSEPMVLLWWALLFRGVVACATRPRPTATLVLTSVVAGAAPFVHGRLAAIPLLWLGFLAANAWTRRPGEVRRGDLLAAWVVTVGVAAGAMTLHRAVGAALWSGEEPALKGAGPTAWVRHADYWVTLLFEVAGQLLYVMVATAGLALAGAALLVRMVWRPTRPGERVVGATLGLMLGSNLAISMVVMAGFLHESAERPGQLLSSPRWDHLVYGRYNDAAAVVLATLGVVWLGGLARRAQVRRFGIAGVLVALGCGVLVGARLATTEWQGQFPTPTAPGLTIAPPAGSGPAVWSWTLTAAALTAAMTWGAVGGRQRLLRVLVVWVLVAGLVGVHHAGERHRRGLGFDLAEDLGPAGGSGAALVVPADVNLEPHVRLTVYQAQFGLVDSGWRTEQTDRRSSVLAAEPGDARALLLMDDVDPPPGRWRQVGRYDTVVVWRRD